SLSRMAWWQSLTQSHTWRAEIGNSRQGSAKAGCSSHSPVSRDRGRASETGERRALVVLRIAPASATSPESDFKPKADLNGGRRHFAFAPGADLVPALVARPASAPNALGCKRN